MKNFSNLNPRAQTLAIGRLEDQLARKDAIQTWSKFDGDNMPSSRSIGADSSATDSAEASSGRRLLQSSTLPNGIYRINYQGSGPCKGVWMCLYFDIISLPIIYLMHGCSYYICIGRVFGYQRNGKDVPGRVSLGAASTKNPGLWQVTNMARSNREITLTAVRNRFERILSLWLWIMDLAMANGFYSW